MKDDAWIFRIEVSTNLIVDHIQESIVLWALINDFLSENVEGDITWKHTACKHYSTCLAKMAYVHFVKRASIRVTTFHQVSVHPKALGLGKE